MVSAYQQDICVLTQNKLAKNILVSLLHVITPVACRRECRSPITCSIIVVWWFNPVYFSGWNKRWNEFIHHQSEQWREIVQLWVIGGLKAGKQVMVVHYEELQRARNTQIIRMLKFLKQSTSKQLMQEFNTFHRQHSNEFEPYTNKQKNYVLSVVQDTIKDLAQNNMQSQINLTQYL